MPDTVLPSHEAILKLCAQQAPNPWYPKVYAIETNVPRDSLDQPLNDLRLCGYVKLTEWIKNLGQGYVLTEKGQTILEDPQQLALLRDGIPKLVDQQPLTEPELETEEHVSNADADFTIPRVTPLLLLVNLLAFGVVFYFYLRQGMSARSILLDGNALILHKLGALSSVDLLHQEWWRLLSCCFLHVGLVHLLFNMYSLWAMSAIEAEWGSPRYLLIYLTSGIAGSCAAMIFNPPATGTILVGASGAIWGILGSVLARIFYHSRHYSNEEMARTYRQFLPIFVLNVGLSLMPGISMFAHFGGGLAGFVMGLLVLVHQAQAPPRRTFFSMLIAGVPIVCLIILSETIKTDPRWHRLADAEKQLAQDLALQKLERDIFPVLDQLNSTLAGFEDKMFIVVDQPPAQRDKDTVKALLPQLMDCARTIDDLNMQITRHSAEDAQFNLLKDAMVDYLTALKNMITTMNDVLANGKTCTAQERLPFLEKIKQTRKSITLNLHDH